VQRVIKASKSGDWTRDGRTQSLGGTRSLVVQPAAMWTRELTEQQLAEAGIAPGLIRFSVGLENEADLIADLDQALAH
jgi:O-acetylhomoserine (thiol)-lyase